MWIPCTRTLVFNEFWEVKPFCVPHPAPEALIASTHSKTEWQAFWLRKAQPSSLFWALQQLPACFP